MHELTILLGLLMGGGPEPADLEFFEKKVRPLLIERCHKCHSTQTKKQKGGLLLDSRASLLKGGDSGPAVAPGQPEKSLLISAVRYQHESVQMPPDGKLPAGEVAVLEAWVRRGAVFPGPADRGTTKQAINLAEARKFWSFQPPRARALPQVADASWPRTRIDSFILAELEKQGLKPAAPASARTLVRRVTFDLTGLPPTPAEVDEFTGQVGNLSYEKLVDQLLASPRYGERWGRFWLDLARYCDVAEQWADFKGQPWRYRDWVVQAFNDDLPFDQFVQRQLAADLMADCEPADRAALGFLGLSPTYWKELKLAPDVIRTVVAEEWEERIDALGRTFLGLSVACARCHDHKFDPITQHDYYALAGVFASIRQTDRAVVPEARLGLADFRLPALTGAALDTALLGKQAQIDQLKSAQLLVPAVTEARQQVLADGPHRTKVEYQPGVAQDVAMQVRGNPANAGPVVPRRFLAVLSPDPKPFRQGSGRLELARALVDEGGPLTARVIVNRVWRHHFGAGLVETPSDFGAQGSRPTHPELLDDLTARFIAHGWSLKWLHREILLSAAYQQSSLTDERKRAFDPDNRWLGRMNRRRLDVEAWRDAMLAAAGTLRPTLGGPPQELSEPANHRRTVYGLVRRRELHDMLRLHDFPDPTAHSANRIQTTTPLQQLFTLNSPFLQQQAADLVRRLEADVPGSVEGQVQRVYQLLFGRSATERQVQQAVAFLRTANPAERAALWQQYAQVLLGSNEFLFVD